MEHLFDKKEIHFLLNEWTISKLFPHTINLVSYDVCNVKEAIGEWTHGASALTNYNGLPCCNIGFLVHIATTFLRECQELWIARTG